MNTLSILLPVLLTVALGAWLRQSGRFSVAFFRDINRLTYHVGLPALLFIEISGATIQGSRVWLVSGVMLGAGLLVACMAAVAARSMRLPASGAAALICGSFRGNIAYVGLPIVLFALSGRGSDGAGWGALASLCLAPMILVYNVACVAIGVVAGTASTATPLGRLRRLVENPLILASLAGGLSAWAGLRWPPVVTRTLRLLGQSALPLALWGLGASLEPERMRGGSVGAAAVSSALQTLLSPLLGWGLALAVGLGPEETLIALVFLACPTAVSLFVMAGPLGLDEHLTGAGVVLSTVIALLPLAVILSRAVP